MLIWLIQTGEPLPLEANVRKYRTAMLANKLVERGDTVRWWASAFEHQRKVMIAKKDRNFNISERYTVRVLRGCRYRKNVSLARYIDHQIVAFKFRMQSKKYPKPDIIVASMPDHLLAYEAACYAQKNGVPFIVDIRDIWPDIFLNRIKNLGLYRLGKLILARDFKLLTALLSRADALAAVSRGYLQWGLDKAGRLQGPFDRVFYHGYNSYATKAKNLNQKLDISDWLKGKEDQKAFIFIGTFGISYELELVLDAARRFQESGRTDICFVVAGTGEQFKMISKKASGLENVILPGWIGEKEINALLNRGYAGLLSYVESAPQGLPNKPFEYLSTGLPLVNSLKGEMAELVDRYQFGLNYSPGDLGRLCACIERIADDSSMHYEMSRNALDFFKKYGDADKIYEEYATYIEKIVENHKKGYAKGEL